MITEIVPANETNQTNKSSSRLDRVAEFGACVKTYRDRLLAVALRVLRNVSDAEDAVQDGLLSAWKVLGSFENRASLSTWLHLCVRNAALMRRRALSRRGVNVGDGPLAHQPTKVNCNPEHIADSAMRSAQLAGLMSRLSRDEQLIIRLRIVHGIGTRQSARFLGLSEGTVKVRLFRAIRRLRTNACRVAHAA